MNAIMTKFTSIQVPFTLRTVPFIYHLCCSELVSHTFIYNNCIQLALAQGANTVQNNRASVDVCLNMIDDPALIDIVLPGRHGVFWFV